MSEKILLDASAYIAYIGREAGYAEVEKIINRACINMVTYTEIISFYTQKGLSKDLLKQLCDYVEILNIDEEVSFNAGFLIKESKKYGLSMGDRFCLATAQMEKCKVYTADKVWLNLKDKISVDIITIQ